MNALTLSYGPLLSALLLTAAQAGELISGKPLDAFRPDSQWRAVGTAEAVPDQQALRTTGEGRILVNSETKDKSIPYLFTKDEYGDARIEMEFMIPKGSNSGVYVMGRYEIQILDSFGRAKVGSGDLGGVYQRRDPSRPKGQESFEGHAPMANAARAPGEWQTFDITFRAPRFDNQGQKIADAVFEKVMVNGVLVQENVAVSGPTTSSPLVGEAATGPVAIQGDHGPIAIRSLRITPVPDKNAEARLGELDAYWAEVSRAVGQGDFEAYKATCHPEAVLIGGRKGICQPLAVALARWEKDFENTRSGKVRGKVEFRFGRRLGDATTAHETGVFRYTILTEGKPPLVEYIRFEALLVKKDARWLILMENQTGDATEADWAALAGSK